MDRHRRRSTGNSPARHYGQRNEGNRGLNEQSPRQRINSDRGINRSNIVIDSQYKSPTRRPSVRNGGVQADSSPSRRQTVQFGSEQNSPSRRQTRQKSVQFGSEHRSPSRLQNLPVQFDSEYRSPVRRQTLPNAAQFGNTSSPMPSKQYYKNRKGNIIKPLTPHPNKHRAFVGGQEDYDNVFLQSSNAESDVSVYLSDVSSLYRSPNRQNVACSSYKSSSSQSNASSLYKSPSRQTSASSLTSSHPSDASSIAESAALPSLVQSDFLEFYEPEVPVVSALNIRFDPNKDKKPDFEVFNEDREAESDASVTPLNAPTTPSNSDGPYKPVKFDDSDSEDWPSQTPMGRPSTFLNRSTDKNFNDTEDFGRGSPGLILGPSGRRLLLAPENIEPKNVDRPSNAASNRVSPSVCQNGRRVPQKVMFSYESPRRRPSASTRASPLRRTTPVSPLRRRTSASTRASPLRRTTPASPLRRRTSASTRASPLRRTTPASPLGRRTSASTRASPFRRTTPASPLRPTASTSNRAPQLRQATLVQNGQSARQIVDENDIPRRRQNRSVATHYVPRAPGLYLRNMSRADDQTPAPRSPGMNQSRRQQPRYRY